MSDQQECNAMVTNHDRTLVGFAADALLERLQTLTQEAAGVKAATDDIEPVHRTRVASRRLRSALAVFEDCLPGKAPRTWRKRIRKITSALGEARDHDVQIEFLAGFLDGIDDANLRPGLERLLLRLRQGRVKEQKRIVKALDRLEERGTLEKMADGLFRLAAQAKSDYRDVGGDAEDDLERVARETILARLEELLFFEPCVAQPDHVDDHHAMRITAKRLRYTMELFAPLFGKGLKRCISAAKELQTVLGDLHDCDVWIAWLPRFMKEEEERTQTYFGDLGPFARLEPGLEHLLADRKARRADLYQKFTNLWGELDEEKIWQGLRVLLGVESGRESVGPQYVDTNPSEAGAGRTEPLDPGGPNGAAV